MLLRPRTLVRTPGVGRIPDFRPKLRAGSFCIFLEQLGVIVLGTTELFVSIVKRWRGSWRARLEVDPALQFLQARFRDLERLIVSIVNNDFDDRLPGRVPLNFALLRHNPLAQASPLYEAQL